MLLKQEVNRMEGNIDSNAVAEIFERIALLLEIKGEDRFKINAYKRVAESLRNESRDIYALYREGKLKEIPGVGKAIEQKICELLESGKLEFYEKLTEEVPDKLLSLYEIPEMGPKRIKTVWEMLGIETPEGLERAAREGKLKDLPEEEVVGAAKELGAPLEMVNYVRENGKLPVVNFAAGGIATPADAALMMALGSEGVFVGSGIFKSKNPAQRAKAIVEAVTHYQEPGILAEVSKNLGEAMPGLDIKTIPLEERLQERGW